MKRSDSLVHPADELLLPFFMHAIEKKVPSLNIEACLPKIERTENQIAQLN